MSRVWVAAFAIGALWLAASLVMSFKIVNRVPPLQQPIATRIDTRRRVVLGVFSAEKYAALKKAKETSAPPSRGVADVELLFVGMGDVKEGLKLPKAVGRSDGEKILGFFGMMATVSQDFCCLDMDDDAPANLTGLALEAGKWPIDGVHARVRVECEAAAAGCLSDKFHCLSRDLVTTVTAYRLVKEPTLSSLAQALAKAPVEFSEFVLPWPVKKSVKAPTTSPVSEEEVIVSVAVVTMQCESACRVQKADHVSVPAVNRTAAELELRMWACRHGYKFYAEGCNAVIPGRDPVWGKMAALLRHFNSADYIMWVDGSVQIAKQGAGVAKVLAKHGSEKELFLSEGHFAAFVARTSEWSRLFLESLLKVNSSQSVRHVGQVDNAFRVALSTFPDAETKSVSTINFSDIFGESAIKESAAVLRAAAKRAANPPTASCEEVVVCDGPAVLPTECVTPEYASSFSRAPVRPVPVCVISDLVKAVDLLQKFGGECDWVLVVARNSLNTDSVKEVFATMEIALTVETFDGPAEYAAALLRAVANYEEVLFVRDEVVLPHAGWSLARFIKSVSCKGPVGFCSLSELTTAFYYARVDFFHYLWSRIVRAPHFGLSFQTMCSLASHFYEWWDPRVAGCVRAPDQGRDFFLSGDRSGHSSTEQWYRNTFPLLRSERRSPKIVSCS